MLGSGICLSDKSEVMNGVYRDKMLLASVNFCGGRAGKGLVYCKVSVRPFCCLARSFSSTTTWRGREGGEVCAPYAPRWGSCQRQILIQEAPGASFTIIRLLFRAASHQRWHIRSSRQTMMLVWEPHVEEQGSHLASRFLPFPLPVSDPSQLPFTRPELMMHERSVHIFVTSTELWGLTHLNDILNSLERCWARNGNSGKDFLGNRKPNRYFFSHDFPQIQRLLNSP